MQTRSKRAVLAPKHNPFNGRKWEGEDQRTIYFLWVKKRRPNGLVENTDLRAADTSREKVELHAEMVRREEPDAEAIWIEERVTNHLYGQRDVALAFRMGLPGLWKRDDEA